jgi:hypothetical protein
MVIFGDAPHHVGVAVNASRALCAHRSLHRPPAAASLPCLPHLLRRGWTGNSISGTKGACAFRPRAKLIKAAFRPLRPPRVALLRAVSLLLRLPGRQGRGAPTRRHAHGSPVIPASPVARVANWDSNTVLINAAFQAGKRLPPGKKHHLLSICCR